MNAFNGYVISATATDSATSTPPGAFARAIQRSPTDPIFVANITLQNIIVDSRYFIAQASNLSNVLAVGIAAGTEVTLENIPAYTNPMLIEVRVRSASGVTKYFPYKTYSYLVREGTTVYIAQTEDKIAEA